MILELDAGNTSVKWRLRNKAIIVASGSGSAGNWDWIKRVQSSCPETIEHIWIACVWNQVRRVQLQEQCLVNFGRRPVFARSCASAAGVTNGYTSNPQGLGIDRWLAILAGYKVTQKACVVVDAGTAMTADIVDAEGYHLGGYIAPGLTMMRNSLLSGTNLIRIDDPFSVSAQIPPGKDTKTAVDGAIMLMAVGLVQQLMAKCLTPPELVITGGDAQLFSAFFPDAVYIPDLVLDGLSLAFSSES